MTFKHPHFDPSPHAKKRRHLYLAVALALIAGMFIHSEMAHKFAELQVGAILEFIFFGSIES